MPRQIPLGVFGYQLLEFEFAATATRCGSGDTRNALRVRDALIQQFLDLLAGRAAAMAKDIVFVLIHGALLLLSEA